MKNQFAKCWLNHIILIFYFVLVNILLDGTLIICLVHLVHLQHSQWFLFSSHEGRSEAIEGREAGPAGSDEAALLYTGGQGGGTARLHPQLWAKDEGIGSKHQAGGCSHVTQILQWMSCCMWKKMSSLQIYIYFNQIFVKS